MKKIVSFLLLIIVIISFSACEATNAATYKIDDIYFEGAGLDYEFLGNHTTIYRVNDIVLLRTAFIDEGKYTIPTEFSDVTIEYVQSGFGAASPVTELTIPNGIKGVGSAIFSNCSMLESVYIGESLEYIVREDNVLYVNDPLFYRSYNLKKIEVDENNKTYYSSGNTLISRKDNEVILGCRTSVLPDNIKTIGTRAFCSVVFLEEIALPKSLKVIEKEAFCECTGLKTIFIPKNVKTIEEYAFRFCSGEFTIYCEAETMPKGWDEKSLNLAETTKANVVWGVSPEEYQSVISQK